jgi:large subunit ribosomal protein L6
MKIEKFEEKIEIPPELEVTIDKNMVSVKNKDRIVSRELRNKQVSIIVKEKHVIISFIKGSKKEKMVAGTFKAHIKNMFKGALKDHLYKLKICSGHFPMNISLNNGKFVVNNFLGEKVPRELKIKTGANVKIEGDLITIESSDKELASQTAANIERLTKVRGRDLRIFQDGIYIIEKDGKGII